MNERLLQYIWQFQCYNPSALTTNEDDPLQIIHPGTLNTNQGPDFLNAKIRIGTTTWAGSIELHINSSDWKNHKHGDDRNYNNVILHVVWQHDIDLRLSFPTLVLQDKVSKPLLNKYDELMHAPGFIPCEKNIHLVNSITWASWKERLLIERLIARTQGIFGYLKKNNNHWEETFWWMLAKNFGLKVNSDAFLLIARSIPIKVLAKYKNQIHQVEALLFGQAGLLDTRFEEDYPKLLQREYLFLKKKYDLQPVPSPLMFMRMRPSNFPTVRLAQLAMLIHDTVHFFSKVKAAPSLKEIKDCLNVTANDYWHYHYVFDERSSFKTKNLGTQMIDNIFINTIIPVLFAYGHYQDEEDHKYKAIKWLEEIKAEKNTVTKGFESLGIENKSAFDSQALLQLKNEYCSKKRCLYCSIGNKLLNSLPHPQ